MRRGESNDRPLQIDADDKHLLSAYRWYRRRDGYYYGVDAGGKTIYLHRIVTSAATGQVVDHINGDTADNRKENLRLVTQRENNHNTVRKARAYYDPRYKNPWYAQAVRYSLSGKSLSFVIGRFNTEEEAREAKNRYIQKNYVGYIVLPA